MSDRDDVESIRADPEPIQRARRASELIDTYRAEVTEIAEIRRQAIEDAHEHTDMSYTAIADALNLTKGRITQIRHGPAIPEND